MAKKKSKPATKKKTKPLTIPTPELISEAAIKTSMDPVPIQKPAEPLPKVKTEPEQRTERLERLLGNPDLIDIICCHISNGGTLITLAETYDVRFGDLSSWIHSDDNRHRRYMAALNDRGEWAVERILQELRTMGFSDVRQAFNEDGSMKPPSQWPEGFSRAVSAVEVDELFEGAGKDREQVGYTKRIKLWDKIKSLELMGKNLKMFVERHELSVGMKLEDLVAAAGKVVELGENGGQDGKPRELSGEVSEDT